MEIKSWWTWSALAGAWLGVGAALWACSSDEPAGGAKSAAGQRSVVLEHEACEGGKGARSLDANGDGKPDIVTVMNGAVPACRFADLDFDGKPDIYEYFDKVGRVRRREAAYDRTGEIDAIELYKDGKLVERHIDTTGHHLIDTWDTFDPTTGTRLTRERDASGDGKIDQWWQWKGKKLTIVFDRNGDGHPDPGSEIVLGEDEKKTPRQEAVDAGATAAERGERGSGSAGDGDEPEPSDKSDDTKKAPADDEGEPPGKDEARP